MTHEAAEQEIADGFKKQREQASFVAGRICSWVARHGKSFEEVFALIDTDGSGEISGGEFRAGMLQMGLAFCDDEIEALMHQLDADGGGSIEMSEFMPKLLLFQESRSADAKSVLSRVCSYLNAHGETAAAVFARLDTDGGGSLDAEEFHAALNTLGISISAASAKEVMDELDMDGGGDLELTELTAKLDEYRRQRRSFAANVLGGVLEYTQRTKTSVTRGKIVILSRFVALSFSLANPESITIAVFARVDADGSGDLDVEEFQDAMASMGQKLTELEVDEVMSELDIDGSGTIEASEFMDKLKQFGQERTDEIARCHEIFAEIDDDKSGFLDAKEVKKLAKRMGFEEQLSQKGFLKKMIAEMEAAGSDGAEGGAAGGADGEVSCDEFIAWYLSIGKFFLKKPHYASLSHDAPSPEEREKLFSEIDMDGSGELDLGEVSQAVEQLWPEMSEKHVKRAFGTADEDGGGLVSLEEFKKLLTFIIFFNKKRHYIDELEENFGLELDGDGFYFACSTLGEPLSDEQAAESFERLAEAHDCKDAIPFDLFLGWLARRNYEDDEPVVYEDDSVELFEDREVINRVLSRNVGEYGDIHLQDLASVMGKRQSGKLNEHKSKRLVRFQTIVTRALEASNLIKEALRFATSQNNSFPNFNDDQLRLIAGYMHKEEFFAGSNVITQGEQDDRYFVLRRGKVEVHIEGVGVVSTLQWGMGFGEVALVLGTTRTATIRCKTPCEVYVLNRAQYESVVVSPPRVLICEYGSVVG